MWKIIPSTGKMHLQREETIDFQRLNHGLIGAFQEYLEILESAFCLLGRFSSPSFLDKFHFYFFPAIPIVAGPSVASVVPVYLSLIRETFRDGCKNACQVDTTAIAEPATSLFLWSTLVVRIAASWIPRILVLVPRVWIINSLYLCYYVTYLALNLLPLWY